MNDRTALSLLIANGPMTRSQLRLATNLSGPTTSEMVRRLRAAGLVDEAGHVPASSGPNAVAYRAHTQASRGVALQMLPKSALACVVDASAGEFPAAEVPLAQPRSAATDVATAIAAACSVADQDSKDIVAVSVGVPGAVSPGSNHLNFVGPLPGWTRRDVRAQLEQQLKLAVLIDNDANLAAIAELNMRKDKSDFVLLWEGEGLRVASVMDGHIQPGATGGAGEIGYLPSPSASQASGKQVTLQDRAGSSAVMRLVRSYIHSVHTYDAALDALAHSSLRTAPLEELAARTVEIVVPVLAVLDPPCVILSGPTGTAGGPDLARLVQAHLQRSTRWRVPILSSAVTNDPVLHGAALTLAAYLTQRLLGLVDQLAARPRHTTTE